MCPTSGDETREQSDERRSHADGRTSVPRCRRALLLRRRRTSRHRPVAPRDLHSPRDDARLLQRERDLRGLGMARTDAHHDRARGGQRRAAPRDPRRPRHRVGRPRPVRPGRHRGPVPLRTIGDAVRRAEPGRIRRTVLRPRLRHRRHLRDDCPGAVDPWIHSDPRRGHRPHHDPHRRSRRRSSRAQDRRHPAAPHLDHPGVPGGPSAGVAPLRRGRLRFRRPHAVALSRGAGTPSRGLLDRGRCRGAGAGCRPAAAPSPGRPARPAAARPAGGHHRRQPVPRPPRGPRPVE